LGAKGNDLGMVCVKPSLVISLDFVTWWCVGRKKKKTMIFENWLDSILSIASEVIWKKKLAKGIDLGMVGT